MPHRANTQKHPFPPAGKFWKASWPYLHVFTMWEETWVPRENPYRHRENMETSHKKGTLGQSVLWTQDLLAVRWQCYLPFNYTQTINISKYILYTISYTIGVSGSSVCMWQDGECALVYHQPDTFSFHPKHPCPETCKQHRILNCINTFNKAVLKKRCFLSYVYLKGSYWGHVHLNSPV